MRSASQPQRRSERLEGEPAETGRHVPTPEFGPDRPSPQWRGLQHQCALQGDPSAPRCRPDTECATAPRRLRVSAPRPADGTRCRCPACRGPSPPGRCRAASSSSGRLRTGGRIGDDDREGISSRMAMGCEVPHGVIAHCWVDGRPHRERGNVADAQRVTVWCAPRPGQWRSLNGFPPPSFSCSRLPCPW
jgi:hypothetical protein